MHALDPLWETMRPQVEAARSESAQAARSQIVNELNQLLRRLRQYQTESEWSSAVLDGASQFARQVALFTLRDGVLHLIGQHKFNLAEGLSFAAGLAGAFETAISSRDTVVALRAPAEVGEWLSSAGREECAHIVPILNGSRVVALLFAGNQDYLDLDAIELIAGLASLVLERQANASLHTHIAMEPTAIPHTGAAAGDEQKSGADHPG
jgi:hypothetical protein